MRKIKKILAWFLSISILVTMSLSSGIGVLAENTPVIESLFSDDFSNSEYTTTNWSNPNQMTVNSDGTVTVAAGKITSPNDSLTWSNYTVEADVKFTPTDGALFVGLVGYDQKLNGGNGYEFGFSKAANSANVQVKLYARGAGNTNHYPTEQPQFSAGTWYHLKMTVDGSTIRCYIGDNLVIEAENSTFTSGAPSLRNIGIGATFDNFKVSRIANESLFSDDFSNSEYTTTNWSNPNQMTVNSDGTVTVAAGKITSPNDSLTWSNYTVEADVKFTPTEGTLFVGLVGYDQKLNGGNGYEFGFSKAANSANVQVKLYARGAGNTNHYPTEQPQFSAGTWYHLKMTVDGSTIRCYIGDNLVIEAENSTFTSGAPSLRNIGIGATFDNFKVSRIVNNSEGGTGDSDNSGDSGASTQTEWKSIRGYQTVDFTKASKNSIILDGYGASYKTEPITLKNFSSVTISYIPRKLNIDSSNNFVVGLSDKEASFVNTVNDSGNGIVVEMITAKGKDNVFAFCDKELAAGKIEKTFTNKLPNVNKNLKDTEIKVTFTRYEQVIDGVEYFGTFTLEAGGNTYSRELQMTDTLKALGDTFYVIAGCQLNVGNIFEITNIHVESLQTVQSVEGEWKNLYEYDVKHNGAVVNFEGGVHLFGKGAAVLSTPIVLKSGDSIAYQIRFNDLQNGVKNSFACAFLDTNTSFFSTSSADNTNGNSGNGFAVEIRSFDNYKMGYAVFCSTVTNGVADDFVNISNIVMNDVSKSVFDIQLTRVGVNADGSSKWKIVVNDRTYKKTFTYTVDKSSSMNALASGMYFSAGCTGKPIQATVMKSTSVELGQNVRSPQTGDTLQAGVYVTVMFCTTILLVIFVYRKRLAYEKTS